MTGAPKDDDKIIFRKVSVAMSRDEKYLALSPMPPCGRGLWHHLLFGPHTTAIPGLSLIGRAAMAEELGWSLEAFDEAFKEVFDQGMAKADWEARVVWLPNALKHNPPQSHNVIKGWRKPWAAIPDCRLKLEAYNRISAGLIAADSSLKSLRIFEEHCAKPSGKPTQKAFAKPSGKPTAESTSKTNGIHREGSRENPYGEDPSQVVEPRGVARTGAQAHARGPDTAGEGTDGGWPQ